MITEANSVILLLVGVWLVILTVVVFKIYSHYRRLTTGVKGDDLREILEQVVSYVKDSEIKRVELEKYIATVADRGKFHIQKFGIVKFNPFSQTGGEHSFALTLLDANNNGFIITSLHSREITRLYIKPVSDGKSKLDLSKEEREALRKAVNRSE